MEEYNKCVEHLMNVLEIYEDILSINQIIEILDNIVYDYKLYMEDI